MNCVIVFIKHWFCSNSVGTRGYAHLTGKERKVLYTPLQITSAASKEDHFDTIKCIYIHTLFLYETKKTTPAVSSQRRKCILNATGYKVRLWRDPNSCGLYSALLSGSVWGVSESLLSMVILAILHLYLGPFGRCFYQPRLTVIFMSLIIENIK